MNEQDIKKLKLSKAALNCLKTINENSTKTLNSNTTFSLEEKGLILRHLSRGIVGEKPNTITPNGVKVLNFYGLNSKNTIEPQLREQYLDATVSKMETLSSLEKLKDEDFFKIAHSIVDKSDQEKLFDYDYADDTGVTIHIDDTYFNELVNDEVKKINNKSKITKPRNRRF